MEKEGIRKHMVEVHLKHDVLIGEVDQRQPLTFPYNEDMTSITYYDQINTDGDIEVVDVGYAIYYGYRMPANEALEYGLGDGTCDIAVCNNFQMVEMKFGDITFSELLEIYNCIYGEDAVKGLLSKPDLDISFDSDIREFEEIQSDFPPYDEESFEEDDSGYLLQSHFEDSFYCSSLVSAKSPDFVPYENENKYFIEIPSRIVKK